MNKVILSLLVLIVFSSCTQFKLQPAAQGSSQSQAAPEEQDDLVVRGVATIEITRDPDYSFSKFIDFLYKSAEAASTATSTVTYNNAAAVTFTINSSLAGGAFTGNTLSLGGFTVSALKDNNLSICNPGGTTKCTTASLAVYSTGTVQGFVNISATPQYGVPIYTSGSNPTTQLILNTPGTAIETVTGMATNKHTVLLTDFTTTAFTVTSDFTNAGSGSYSSVYVIQYALSP